MSARFIIILLMLLSLLGGCPMEHGEPACAVPQCPTMPHADCHHSALHGKHQHLPCIHLTASDTVSVPLTIVGKHSVANMPPKQDMQLLSTYPAASIIKRGAARAPLIHASFRLPMLC